MLVGTLPRQGQPQCAQAPSPFRASGEGRRQELDSDFQMADSESSSAFWLAYMVVKVGRIVGS